MNTQELKNLVYNLGEKKSILTETELLAYGASLDSIAQLVKLEVLYPSAQGIYMPENAKFGEHHMRVEALVRFPNTVLCLLSALSFYRLTTQMPQHIWIAYQEQDSMPVEPKLPINPVLIENSRFNWGIETFNIEGISIKVYSQAKTIADCFIYQHLVGIDVAEEAFNQAVQENRCTVSEILNFVETDKLDMCTTRELKNCIDRASVEVV